MIRKLFPKKKSVASIMAVFAQTIANLRAFSKEKEDEAERLSERADDLRNEADAVEDKSVDATLESIDAEAVADRLDELLGTTQAKAESYF
jgi:uncharacterized protein (UPF0305 family)